MAKRNQFKMSISQRQSRRFSDNFKQTKVRELEQGRISVSEISKQYEVSTVNVYRWLSKFGSMKNKEVRMVVETNSDTRELLDLKKKVAELERIIGQKQVLLDFKDKMIDIAEETYGVDIKKKFSTKLSSPSGRSGNNTPLV